VKRIVVFGQGGPFGRRACRHVADRLAQRFGLKLRSPTDIGRCSASALNGCWIAVEAVNELSLELLRFADTAVWLNYSAWAVGRELGRGLRRQRAGGSIQGRPPRLIDVGASLLHVAYTPCLHHWLQQPSLAHLRVHHLRHPAEAAFWMLAQEHRMPAAAAAAQPA